MSQTQVYNSDNDDGDELFETIPTQILDQLPSDRPSKTHTTQPTQILDTPPRFNRPKNESQARSPSPAVHVTASSPLQQSSTPHGRPSASAPSQGAAWKNGAFINRMAPPGTTFRSPVPPHNASSQASQSQLSQWPGQVMTQPEQAADGRISDSDSSSDGKSNDIKPTAFERSGGPLNLSAFKYDSGVPQKRPSSEANLQRPAKLPRQAGPSPMAYPDTMVLDDIQDWELRNKVQDVYKMFSQRYSVQYCLDMLVKARSNVSDAMELIAKQQEQQDKQESGADRMDLTGTDGASTRKPSNGHLASSKQTVSGSRSISQKWSSLEKTAQRYPDADLMNIIARAEKTASQQTRPNTTQPPTASRPIQPVTKTDDADYLEIIRRAEKQVRSKQQVSRPKQTIAQKYSTATSTTGTEPANKPVIPMAPSTATPPPKQRRRLIKGRRAASPVEASPTPPPPPKPAPPRSARAAANSKKAHVIGSDESEIDLGDEDDEDDSAVEVTDSSNTALAAKVLNFLNTASVKDILEMCSQPQENVEFIVSKRPFDSLGAVRIVTIQSESKTKTGKTRVAHKQVGDRLVEVCLEVFEGYQAVDDLVARCEDLGKPIAAGMKEWGFNAYSTDSGELEMVDLDAARDSGIGSPASTESGNPTDHAKSKLLKQPKIMNSEITLKDYQLAGLNWLALLFSKRLSCILADDMGLGKTCQVIAFLSHLQEIGVKGPHLVVVPGSTLENWLREFRNFCPALRVVPYYGSQNDRFQQQEDIRSERDAINVVVTTYDMATKKDDAKFFRKLEPVCTVFDEGHALRSSNTQRYQSLMRIPAEFRLLLTGTPLQNNLQELISLLAFLMPHVFEEHRETLQYIFKHRAKTTDEDHAALLSAQRISRARSMMTPFVLRRKKHQVLRHLPPKTCNIEYTTLTEVQKTLYEEIRSEARKVLLDPYADADAKKAAAAKGAVESKQSNVIMKLRQAALHPMLFRRLYNDQTLRKMAEQYKKTHASPNDINIDFVIEDLSVMTDFEIHRFCLDPARSGTSMAKFALKGEPWMEAGKIIKLVEILQRFIADGHRTLIFSQFTTVLNILELVLSTVDIKFYRLDGSTRMNERQDLLDAFYEDDTPVFMLSTKAGGAGINLACANKVIIFDSSFNPQDDIQAENRAHRVGQTRKVEVIRLVTRDTIEEQIYALGQSKLVMDERVAGGGDVADAKAEAAAESQGQKLVEEMMKAQLGGKDGDTPKAAPETTQEVSKEKDEATPTSSAEKKKARRTEPDADIRDSFLKGLKRAGLDVSASDE